MFSGQLEGELLTVGITAITGPERHQDPNSVEDTG